MNKKLLARLAFASSMALGAAAFAQSDGPPRNDNGGPPSREQMQQRFDNMVKDRLGVTDEEWTALQPKIEAVRSLKRDASGQMSPPGGGPGGPGGGRGGPGGPDGGGGDRQNGAQSQSDRGGPDGNNAPQHQDRGQGRGDHKPSAVEQASHDLRDAIDNDASAEDIQAKIKALRDARTAAKSSLSKAQTELQTLVTPRQEAVLVSIGLLD